LTYFFTVFSPKQVKLGFFIVSALGPESALASLAVDDVRDVINVGSVEVSDVKVLKMVKRAEVTLELEPSQRNHLQQRTDAEKATNLDTRRAHLTLNCEPQGRRRYKALFPIFLRN